MNPRPTPSLPRGPHRASMPPQPIRRDVLGPLHAATMTHNGKPVLPFDIIARVLDHLPIETLMTCARTCRRVRDMVYDDGIWVHKLRAMGVWNEQEARRRYDEAMAARRKEFQRRKDAETKAQGMVEGGTQVARPESMTIFDAVQEEKTQRKAKEEEERRRVEVDRRRTMGGPPMAAIGGRPMVPLGELLEDAGGFANMAAPIISTMAAPILPERLRQKPIQKQDVEAMLTVFASVVSARGYARQEYGRIHGALAPLYLNLASARTHTDPILFRKFREPEQQAIMLAQLRIFGRADSSYGWHDRLERLESMTSIFENAALREFEGGYEAQDIDGRMKRYAKVLILLNGGQACIQLFVQKHPVMFERERLGNPMDCFVKATPGLFSLKPSKEFFSRLGKLLNEQASVIDHVFPNTVNVMIPFLERVAEDVIAEYVTPILDEAHERDVEMYLKAVGGIFQELRQFSNSISKPKGTGSEEHFRRDVWRIMGRVFEPHVDLYLQEELDDFKRKAQSEVDEWGKKVFEADAATVSLLMSSVNREADKRDFLSTFKKVILMPVQAIPLAPFMKTFSNSNAHGHAASASVSSAKALEAAVEEATVDSSSRTATPHNLSRSSTPVPHVPTTELAAKAAIMNSRLEGIRSLFSIEVALKLVHLAKGSLERAAQFAMVEGQTGEEAKEQCEAIFITLLHVLGTSHIKAGFDKALDHLTAYNPRDVSHNTLGVAPLVVFLELVNIGDLIQQMVDVFYEQELVAGKLTDKNDFLNPAAKEKKKFEQMLDERVAAGLNRGIDVLIDEVDYLFATTQLPTDYNPGLAMLPEPGGPPSAGGVAGGASAFAATLANAFTPSSTSNTTPDLPSSTNPNRQSIAPRDFNPGPTPTAARIVSVISSHTSLLTGTADKHVLDVFNQEVGVRLFTSLCKHIKRQRISVDGAVSLISDLNHYHAFISEGLRLKGLVPWFNALREMGQLFLIDRRHARQMAQIIADTGRFGGVFRVEEVYEYAERREDWFKVRREVERAMYGFGACVVM